MNRDNAGIGALMVAIFGALMLVTSPSSRQTFPPTGHLRSAQMLKPQPADRSAEALINEFLDFPTHDQSQIRDTTSLSSIDEKNWPTANHTSDLRSAYKLRFLIATVPEPISASLRSDFDNLMAAIQQAMQTDKYLIDSFYLPWKDKEEGNPLSMGDGIDIDDHAGNNLGLIKADDEDEKRYKNEPGIILFRKDATDEDRELLVLFLVGETPTGGVRKEALMEALQQVSYLARWQTNQPNVARMAGVPPHIPPYDSKADDPGSANAPSHQIDVTRSVDLTNTVQKSVQLTPYIPAQRRGRLSSRAQISALSTEGEGDQKPIHRLVRLLGPSYSGSADSIELTLKTWQSSFACLEQRLGHCIRSSAPDIEIRSSGASAINTDNNFTWSKVGPRITYRSFEVPQPEAKSAAIEYLTNAYDIRRNQIAILSESATAFGGAIAAVTRRATPTPSPTPHVSVMPYVGPTPIFDENTEAPLELKFPYHIADIRNSFGRRQDDDDRSLDLRPPSQPLPQEDSEDSKYVVPSFSPRTAATTQLVIDEMLQVIAGNDIRAVGIAATDVEDKVFLARRVRERFPNIVVFIFGSDLIYLHDEVNPDLQGMLVFSSYPLFGLNQFWTYPYDRNRYPQLFPNENSEAAYNATLDLIGDDDPWRNNIIEYAEPLSSSMKPPGYWVSVVGNNALWPVKFLPVAGNDMELRPDFSTPTTKAAPAALGLWGIFKPDAKLIFPIPLSLSIFSTSYRIIVGLLTFFGILPALVAIAEVSGGWDAYLPAGLVRLFGRPVVQDNHRNLRLYQLSFHSVLMTVYLLIAGPFLLGSVKWMMHGFACWPINPLCVALLSILLAFVVISAGLMFAIFRLWLARSELKSAENLFLLCVSICLLVLSIFQINSLFSITDQAPSEDTFFQFVRYVAFGSRVASIAPVMFVGAAALTLLLCALRRSALLDERPIGPIYLNFDKSFGSIKVAENAVRALLEQPLTGAGFYVFASIVASLDFLLWLGNGIPHSVDGKWFLLVFAVGAGVVYNGLLLTLARFYMAWQELRKLLRALYAHPSRNAYQKVYDKLPETNPQNAPLRIDLFDKIPSQTGARISIEVATEIREIAKADSDAVEGSLRSSLHSAWTGWFSLRLETDWREARSALDRINENDEVDGGWRKAAENRIEAERTLSNLTSALGRQFEVMWNPKVINDPQIASQHQLNLVGYLKDHSTSREQKKLDDKMVELAQIFVGARVFDYLRQVLPQLQNLALFANAGLILMLLAISSYPFPREYWLVWFSWLTVVGSVSVVLRTFVQMNRDKVLSMLSGTTPGALNFNGTLWLQIFTYGVIPVLGVVGVQFPGGIQQLFGWFGKLGH